MCILSLMYSTKLEPFSKVSPAAWVATNRFSFAMVSRTAPRRRTFEESYEINIFFPTSFSVWSSTTKQPTSPPSEIAVTNLSWISAPCVEDPVVTKFFFNQLTKNARFHSITGGVSLSKNTMSSIFETCMLALDGVRALSRDLQSASEAFEISI